MFKALNRRNEGDALGWDVGYNQVADMLWTAALRKHRPEAYILAVTEHILNGIPDVSVRNLAAQRLRQAVNIAVPDWVVFRDV